MGDNMSTKLSPFGVILRQYRTSNKITLDQLGKELKLSKSFISYVERGHKPVTQKLLNYVLFRVPTCKEEEDSITRAADYQAKEIRLDIELTDAKRKHLASEFKRRVHTLTLRQINDVMKILKKDMS